MPISIARCSVVYRLGQTFPRTSVDRSSLNVSGDGGRGGEGTENGGNGAPLAPRTGQMVKQLGINISFLGNLKSSSPVTFNGQTDTGSTRRTVALDRARCRLDSDLREPSAGIAYWSSWVQVLCRLGIGQLSEMTERFISPVRVYRPSTTLHRCARTAIHAITTLNMAES